MNCEIAKNIANEKQLKTKFSSLMSNCKMNEFDIREIIPESSKSSLKKRKIIER